MAEEKQYTFGMIGLGTMGCNLLLNMAEHGFSVAGYDKDENKVTALEQSGKGMDVKGFKDIGIFVNHLKKPRAVMMLVPAGKIVDAVIADLLPFLEEGDLIIDGGNSYFADTDRRDSELKPKGIHFFGMGISGGEEGARNGPSMMPGGDKEAYQHVKNIFEAISAHVNGEPCVSYMGPGSAGHFVKMVHNGIEYALMQLIAETYQLLKNGMQLDNAAIQKIFAQWNQGRLQSFLLEITADIFTFKVPGTDHLLLDDIKDEAKAKGTGKWTSQIAMDLQVPVPMVDIAVSMRDLSKFKELRTLISGMYKAHNKEKKITDKGLDFIGKLEQAFYFSMVITYAQGMHLLYQASRTYAYDLQMANIAKIWRGGCIIRSAFLESIYSAFSKDASLQHLLADAAIHQQLSNALPATREVISMATADGYAVPAFATSLTYFDTLRTENMPTNLVQAQRDYFGAHTYELIEKNGVFHTNWNSHQITDHSNK